LAKALEVNKTVMYIVVSKNSMTEAVQKTISDALKGRKGYNIQSTGEVDREFIGNKQTYIYIYIYITQPQLIRVRGMCLKNLDFSRSGFLDTWKMLNRLKYMHFIVASPGTVASFSRKHCQILSHKTVHRSRFLSGYQSFAEV